MFEEKPTTAPPQPPHLALAYNGKLIPDLTREELIEACLYMANRMREQELAKERALRLLQGSQQALLEGGWC